MKLVKLAIDPIQKVYDGLAAEEVERVKSYQRPPRRFRASEAAACRRQIWYRLSGHVPAPDLPWLRLVAEAGSMYHDYTRYIMNAHGVGLTGFEVIEGRQVEDKYTLRTFEHDDRRFDVAAQSDAGIELEVDDAKALASVEIKSMSFFRYDKVNRAFRSGGDEAVFALLQQEHPKYIWQANTTAMVKGMDYVLLVLVGRSGNDLGLSGLAAPGQGAWPPRVERRSGAVWRVEEQDKGNILQKFADIDRALNAGDPPPPDFTDGSTECKQCAMWVYCYGAKKRAKYPIPGVVA